MTRDSADWYIDDVRADALARPIPTTQAGETSSYRFVFDSVGDSGENLVNERDYLERYELVRDRLRHAGQYVTKRQVDGSIRWHEQTPTGADPLSVKLEPEYDADDPADAVWGLVESGTHRAPIGDSKATVTLDILVVAPADDYDTRRALEADRRFGN